MCVLASSYCNYLTAVLGDLLARWEHLGDFRVHVGDDRHSLHLLDKDSDEERGCWTPPPEHDAPLDVVVVVIPSAGSS